MSRIVLDELDHVYLMQPPVLFLILCVRKDHDNSLICEIEVERTSFHLSMHFVLPHNLQISLIWRQQLNP